MSAERVAIRGTLRGALIFCDRLEIDLADGDWLEDLATQHAEAILAGTIDQIEIEFVDEPAPVRFLRVGTNPRGMRTPIRIGGDA